MSRALKFAFSLALLTTPASALQMPARPGKLHISSSPPGAKITINHTERSEVTDVTLIVSPGTYSVLVGNCSEKSVQVSSGETKEVSCP
jgi:hypothetical protein